METTIWQDCPKPKKTSTHKFQTISPRMHATFSTNAHIPTEMWKSISAQLETLMLVNRKLNKYTTWQTH